MKNALGLSARTSAWVSMFVYSGLQVGNTAVTWLSSAPTELTNVTIREWLMFSINLYIALLTGIKSVLNNDWGKKEETKPS